MDLLSNHDPFSLKYDELKNKVDNLDLSKLSSEELNQLKAEAELTQIIYRNFELVVKRDANSLYGSSGNIYFSLCNYNVATDITTSGKHFGLIVDRAINKFFQNWSEKEWQIIKDNFYNDLDFSKCRQFLEYEPDTENDLCVYGDTDSRYIDLSMIYDLIGKDLPSNTLEGDKELSDFGVFIDETFLRKIIADTIDADIEYRNATKGHMKMAHEVTTRNAIFQAKKKYIMSVIWKDGKLLKEPKMKYTGVEIKKGESSKRIKNIIEILVKKYLVKDVSTNELKEEIFNLFKYIKTRRQKSLIYRISTVSNLKEIYFDDKSNKYVSDKTYIQMQMALFWYNFVHQNKEMQYKLPFEGQKMNFYYDINRNVVAVPDDLDIDNVPNLPEPDWNVMIKQVLVKPILKYILDKRDTVTDTDVDGFLVKTF